MPSLRQNVNKLISCLTVTSVVFQWLTSVYDINILYSCHPTVDYYYYYYRINWIVRTVNSSNCRVLDMPAKVQRETRNNSDALMHVRWKRGGAATCHKNSMYAASGRKRPAAFQRTIVFPADDLFCCSTLQKPVHTYTCGLRRRHQ